MDILRNDVVVLMKEVANNPDMRVGGNYEVASITDTFVVVRDQISKIAVGSFEFDRFEEYFKRVDSVHQWTEWIPMSMNVEDEFICAFYRTNFKKVQVVTADKKVRGEASCNVKHGDKFNLYNGIRLASFKCVDNYVKKQIEEENKKLEKLNTMRIENNNLMKKFINRISDVEEQDD